MLRCLVFSALVLAPLGTIPPTADASPITYDFTGVLDHPYDGATSFSGSFTIDSNPTEIDTGYIAAGGSGASMTVRLGDQVLNFVNDPHSPTGGFGVTVKELPSYLEEPPGVSEYEIAVGGTAQNGLSFVITSYISGWVSDLPNLESLTFPSISNSVGLTDRCAKTVNSSHRD